MDHRRSPNPTTEPLGDAPDPDPSRIGARWVAATGAFLLVVAAGVFVAVRWDELPDAARLGIVALATGLFLTAGRALRTSLPVTANALFHLGAFLVPVDVAALCIHLGWGWEAVVATEGAVGLLLFPLLGRLERTRLLAVATATSGIAAASGAAALAAPVVPVSAAVLLVVASTAALAARRDGLAATWALAGAALPLGAAVPGAVLAHEAVLGALGIAHPPAPWMPLAVGIGAAAVLGALAHRHNTLVPLPAAAAALALGTGASWVEAEPPAVLGWAALAACFLTTQLAATALARDAFWGRPLGWCATAAAALATVGLVPALGALLAATIGAPAERDTVAAAALAVAGAGWAAAGLRHRRHELGCLAAPAAIVSVAAGVTVAAGAGAGSIALVALAAGVAAAAPRGGLPSAIGALWWAPALALALAPEVAVGTGAAGALVLGWAARRGPLRGPERPALAERTWLLGLAGLVPAVLAAFAVALALSPALGLASFALVTWGTAALADGREPFTDEMGLVLRGAALLVLGFVGELSPEAALGLGGLITAAAVADGLAGREPRAVLGSVAGLPVTVPAAAVVAGAELAPAGVVLCLAGAVLAGAAALLRTLGGDVVDRRTPWVTAATWTAASSLAGGVALASSEQAALAPALVLVGGVVVALAVLRPSVEIGIAGGFLAVVGVWLQLDLLEVQASDAYAAPVGALLVTVGWLARRAPRPPSSWVAYGPALALVGGTALAERLDGGGGEHALAAGAVGVGALLVGAWRRLAGPLVIGTALLVAVALHESLLITGGVPTWAWLALGGALLLGAGVQMERHAVGPLDTGRRIAEVLAERYR